MHKLLIFNDEKLLLRALTHRSYVNENPGEIESNERLEPLTLDSYSRESVFKTTKDFPRNCP